MTDIVTLTNLTKTYNGVPALRDVTMSIPSGKIVGLLGPNGSGTVSYTHLDVYKRQIQSCTNKLIIKSELHVLLSFYYVTLKMIWLYIYLIRKYQLP